MSWELKHCITATSSEGDVYARICGPTETSGVVDTEITVMLGLTREYY